MNGILQRIRRVFDTLYESTANETVEDTPYGERQTTDGVYAITNTQSSNSTYGPSEATEGERDGEADNATLS